MQLADIITTTSVKVLGATSSKKRLLQDLGDLAGTAYGLSPANVVEALIEREGLEAFCRAMFNASEFLFVF